MRGRSQSIAIEFARQGDAAEIGGLSRRLVEHGLPGWSYTQARVLGAIRDRSTNVVVARRGPALVGFGIMAYAGQTANLNLLAVQRAYRRGGVGRTIVRWLEEVATVAGIFDVYVQVRDRNRAALAFYGKLGYEVVNVVAGYYHGVESALVLYKNARR